MEIILASGSPRRKELLKLIVPVFKVLPSNVEEKIDEGLTKQEQAMHLAYIKAKDVFQRTEGDRTIIGADTIVVKNNKIYGKPKSKEDAKNMLKELLSGDGSHSVITGICIMTCNNGEYREYKDFDETKIFLKNMSDNEIDTWISTGKAMDKAGAYGIQDEFCVFVDKIIGNYTTVVGLPTHKVYDIISLQHS